MAIKNPFQCILKSSRQQKITITEELTFWIDVQDTMNNLISRFNLASGAGVNSISFITTETKEAPLSAEDYDYNLTEFETSANQMIVSGAALGYNAANTLSLIKATTSETPLTTAQRDANCGTIQIFINTAHQLFSIAGI